MLNKVSRLFSADVGLESLFFLSCFLHVCLCNTLFENSPGKVWRCRLKTMHGGGLHVRKSEEVKSTQHLMEVCALSTLYYLKLDNRINI